MIVTEAEANSKQCPMAMVISEPVGCLGSSCMWWRWDDPAEHTQIDESMPDAYHAADLIPPRGFCAAAGKLHKERFSS